MTATISSLPEELIEDILSRVPLKYMRAVRLSCKNWGTLSKRHTFTKMHIGKLGQASKGESRMVVLMDHGLHLMSVVVDDDPPITERKGTLLNGSGQVIRFSQVFYCDGLLLCILKDDTRVVVWNPYWGQTRWIQPRFSYRPCEFELFVYALGYKKRKSCRSYKFLRFIDTIVPVIGRVSVYEIYDFDSDLWTTLDVDPQCRISAISPGASLKGNTYWGATRSATRRSSSPRHVDHMIFFDFTRERFGPLLPLPSRLRNDYGDELVYLSCVREEKLAAFFYHKHPLPIEIWITAKIEAETEISWTKVFTVDAGRYTFIPLTPSRVCFFIDEVKKVVVLFEQTLHRKTVITFEFSGSVRVVDLGEPADPHAPVLMYPYVHSSVQVKQPARRKRKRQGSLERSRFNQNMLRFPMLEQFRENRYEILTWDSEENLRTLAELNLHM